MSIGVQYYLIHGIDASRKPFMENQFKRHGIPSEKVKWINRPNKNDELPEGICPNPQIPKGAVACTYKHYLILKDICENNHPLGVIMEDNIEFRANVPQAIQRYLHDLPPDWDLVFDSDFYNLRSNGSIVPEKSVYLQNYERTANVKYSGQGVEFVRRETLGVTKGAHFVLINLNAAKRLYERFLPFYKNSDHHYNHLLHDMNMKVYWAEPPNVHKIQRESTWLDSPIKRQLNSISWLKKR